MPFSVEQSVHNWNQRETKIPETEMQSDGCLKRLEVLLVLKSCVMLQVLCGVFDAGCRNSVLFLAVLKCLKKKSVQLF